MLRRSNTSSSISTIEVPQPSRWHLSRSSIAIMFVLLTVFGASGLFFGFTHFTSARAAQAQLGLNLDVNEQALVDVGGPHARIDQLGSTTLT